MFPIIQYSLFWKGAQYFLHHGQVFSVVMSLEEGESQIEFEHDAANAPDITRLRPAKFCGKTELTWWEILKTNLIRRVMFCIYTTFTQYHFRSSVVSGRHDFGMVFPIEGGWTEINQPDLSVFHFPHITSLKRQKYRYTYNNWHTRTLKLLECKKRDRLGI